MSNVLIQEPCKSTRRSPILLASLRGAIAEHGLKSAQEWILSKAVEGYAIMSVGAEHYAIAGNSRLGGLPDLPRSVAWPIDAATGLAATFIGQINFAELPLLSSVSRLPRRGILYIFASGMNDDETQFQPLLIFVDEPTQLARTSPPSIESANVSFNAPTIIPRKIQPIPRLSLPFFHEHFRQHVVNRVQAADPTQAADAIRRRLEELGEQLDGDQIGQLFGYASEGASTNRYRRLAIRMLGKPDYVGADCWESPDELDDVIAECHAVGDFDLAVGYCDIRPDVEWISENEPRISEIAEAWKLLLHLKRSELINFHLPDDEDL